MRFLLTLMAMAVLAVSFGCDKKPDAAATPSASAGAAGRTMEPPAEATSTADASAVQTVSLKLPGMT